MLQIVVLLVMRLLKEWFTPELTSEVAPLPQNCSWKLVRSTSSADTPCQRSLHAVCVSDDFLFLYGGRGPHGSLNDLWKYNIEKQSWSTIHLPANHLKPPSLEGHSLVYHDNFLYVFGGETSFASGNESPLWKFCLNQLRWTKLATDGAEPIGRREHVGMLYDGSIFIHGGYIDLKGPTEELWKYDIRKKSWKLFQFFNTVFPTARYKHSGIIFQDLLWICGGLMGVTDKNETQVWTWDLLSQFWSPIKIRGAPTQLFNHASCLVGDEVFICGGNQESGKTSSKLWRAKLKELSRKRFQNWKVCQFHDKVLPSALCNHCLLALPIKKSSHACVVPDVISDSSFKKKLHSDSVQHNVVQVCGADVKNNITDSSENSVLTSTIAKTVKLSKEKIKMENSSTTSKQASNESLFKTMNARDVSSEECNKSYGDHGNNIVFNSKEDLIKKPGKSEFNDFMVEKRFRYKYEGYVNKSYVDSPNSADDLDVKRFSYNLSSVNQAWKPIKSRRNKYHTTSFIDISGLKAIKDKDCFTIVNSRPNSTVIYSKKDLDDEVTLPSVFYQNAKLLSKLEDDLQKVDSKIVDKPAPRHRSITILLIGGTPKTGYVRLKEPLQMWKCSVGL